MRGSGQRFRTGGDEHNCWCDFLGKFLKCPLCLRFKGTDFFPAVIIWHDLWNPPRAGFSVKSGPRRTTAGAAAVGWCWFKAHIPTCFLCSRKAKPAGPRLLGVHGFWGCRCTWESRRLFFFFPNEYLNWLLTVSWVRYYCSYFLSLFFFTMLRGLWDLSSPVKNWTQALCSECMES